MENKVSIRVFFSVISIFTIVIGWLFSSIRTNAAKVKQNREETYKLDIKYTESISTINTNIDWIKRAIEGNNITYKEDATTK